jgi:hypothetical protein
MTVSVVQRIRDHVDFLKMSSFEQISASSHLDVRICKNLYTFTGGKKIKTRREIMFPSINARISLSMNDEDILYGSMRDDTEIEVFDLSNEDKILLNDIFLKLEDLLQENITDISGGLFSHYKVNSNG